MTVSADNGRGARSGVDDSGPEETWTARFRARFGRRGQGRHGRHAADGRSGGHEGTPQSTAFVLAGGGSRGAVQVGMLQELVARGIRADRVFGASVGAINGAEFFGSPTSCKVSQCSIALPSASIL